MKNRLSVYYEDVTWWVRRIHLRSPPMGETSVPLRREHRGKEVRWQDSCGKEPSKHTLYRDLWGIFILILEAEGRFLKLIILLPLYSFLPGCSQAKLKASPVSPVPNWDTRWKAGWALERREEGTGKDQLWGLWQPGKSPKALAEPGARQNTRKAGVC